jgi:hypothetical protein
MYCSETCDCVHCSAAREVFCSELEQSGCVDVTDDWDALDAALGLDDDSFTF